jgi:hypothetical protein
MKIGQLESSGAAVGRRDAFHVAAVLVCSNEPLDPGDSIQFHDDSFTTVMYCANRRERHAVVDPFISSVRPGEKFWALLIPDAARDLVHHYEIKLPNVPARVMASAEVFADELDEEDEHEQECKTDGCW